jgi:hypothetical protein
LLRILHFFTSPFFTITTMWQIIKSQSTGPLTEMLDQDQSYSRFSHTTS